MVYPAVGLSLGFPPLSRKISSSLPLPPTTGYYYATFSTASDGILILLKEHRTAYISCHLVVQPILLSNRSLGHLATMCKVQFQKLVAVLLFLFIGYNPVFARYTSNATASSNPLISVSQLKELLKVIYALEHFTNQTQCTPRHVLHLHSQSFQTPMPRWLSCSAVSDF